MDRTARKILYDDLKSKGFSHEEANEQLNAWDSTVKDKIAGRDEEEEEEEKPRPRHGTTCVGIVSTDKQGRHKTVAEW